MADGMTVGLVHDCHGAQQFRPHRGLEAYERGIQAAVDAENR